MTHDLDSIYDEIELPEETGEKVVIYYIMGMRPIKVTFIDDFPEYVLAFDFEKNTFIQDRSVMKLINDSFEVKKVDQNDFANACLALGVKPI